MKVLLFMNGTMPYFSGKPESLPSSFIPGEEIIQIDNGLGES